jgi:hypothetical protein
MTGDVSDPPELALAVSRELGTFKYGNTV